MSNTTNALVQQQQQTSDSQQSSCCVSACESISAGSDLSASIVDVNNVLTSLGKRDDDDNYDNIDDDDDETDQSQTSGSGDNDINIKHKMYIFLREICLLLFLVFTYAAFQTSIPKSTKTPNAYPFFPATSIVKDWYQGQLSDAIELASESDIAFIMYYAPWDAESQATRRPFAKLAEQMHFEVHFAAINCWQPLSECRQQYSKVYSWPVLMAYPIHGRGIQYRGPRQMEYMMRFLDLVANPFVRIYSMADVPKYQAIFDAVVVAQVNARLADKDYGVYYYTALQFLERDPFRDVRFLIYTRPEIKRRTLSLYLWNSTVTYKHRWHPEKILAWLGDSLHQVSAWVSPTGGGKSESLSSYLQPGPALILFTPKNPLYPTIDYYSILHDVAFNYYTCNSNIHLKRVLNQMLRKEYNLAYKHSKSKCCPTGQQKTTSQVLVTFERNHWLNTSCDCAATTNGKGNKPLPFVSNTIKEELNIVEDELEGEGDRYDWRSPLHLQSLHESRKCRMFRLAHAFEPAHFAFNNLELDESKSRVNVTGLACTTNTSLAFLALDSLQYYYFAEALGIDILRARDKTALVILNPNLETHHVMKLPFNTKNLEHFIWMFENGLLKRTLTSTVPRRQFTHHYITTNTSFTSSSSSSSSCSSSYSSSNANGREFSVKELNTRDFLPTVMRHNLAVVVMYYSTKCAFCSGVSHTLLTVAKILEPVAHRLQFARIDGDNHALPWEYSMHHYPNILYFPSRRKSESRIFPQNVPITVTNLLSFILANVEYPLKLNAMWAVCNQTLFDEDFNNCIQSIKSECVAQIGQILKVYRLTSSCNNNNNNNQQRRELLKHLEHLRSLHFLLENPARRHAIEKHMSLLRFIEKVPIQLKTKR